MNMNMNQKMIVTILGILIALVLIILIAIIVLENTNSKKVMNFSNVAQVENKNEVNEDPEENTVENKIENKVENTTEDPDKITGEIEEIETEDGGKIPVPPTFEYIEGSSTEGAVIADEDGNEFVWIPVGNINNYQRQLFLHNGEGGNSESTLEEENIRDINAYNEEFDDSIRNYGGFYIARFEAGKGEEDKLVSKKDELVWTGVTWEKARDLSLNMYKENDFFQTDLVNSYAWDTICTWLRNCGINIDDSTEIGNYQNNVDNQKKIVATGSNEKWKTNNIYDMAGNAWEYTTEECGEHEKYHMGRGGGFWNEGHVYPISSRGQSEDNANLAIGFRVVMYLK